MTRFACGRWLAIWIVLGLLLLGVAFYFDAAMQNWVGQHPSHSARNFMRAVSKWGDWPPHVVIGVVGAAVAYGLGNRKWTTIFVAMVMACALAGLLNPIIKVSAGRSRPSVTTNVGWNGPSLNSKYHAFPSGHTIASTAFFGTLICARPLIGLLFVPIPLLIAASRIYLNAHHLSDVVAGALLGVWCALLVWCFVTQRIDRERLSAQEHE